jgi:energy-converting hydrogenase Eha subunit G
VCGILQLFDLLSKHVRHIKEKNWKNVAQIAIIRWTMMIILSFFRAQGVNPLGSDFPWGEKKLLFNINPLL